MQQTANGLYAGRRDGVRNLRNWSIKMKLFDMKKEHSEQLACFIRECTVLDGQVRAIEAKMLVAA
jgi:hypothetical protein